MRSRAYMTHIGLEGALLVLCPVPLLFSPGKIPLLLEGDWLGIVSSLTSLFCFVFALTLFRKPVLAKYCGLLAAIGFYFCALPYVREDPFVALLANVLLLGSLYLLFEFRIKLERSQKTDHKARTGQRALWGAFALPLAIFFQTLAYEADLSTAALVIGSSLLMSTSLYLHWTWVNAFRVLTVISLFVFLTIALVIFSISKLTLGQLQILALILSLIAILSLPRNSKLAIKKEHWWDIFFSHPERILITTFMSLCLVGTALLLLPISTSHGAVPIIDAAFTAVSAVCVTGLITLDTPKEFTLAGQFFILLLIQLGGLGIMSITTVALHAMGRRLSLKQERLLTTLTDTSHNTLIHSLKLILAFTVIVETLGALLLFFSFLMRGDSIAMAAWRGIFTAISAFCNAGFALQSDSLMPYQEDLIVLHTTALLIILGGLAPAMSLLIPNWIRGRSTSLSAKVALTTTSVLLIMGTLLFLVFEWSGTLSELPLFAKIHNAWFQSVTLRTAGFNSIDITTISSPTFLFANLFMFIGGSPGGTAGGIKTTTIGVLALIFWANLTGRNLIVVNNRRISDATIFRAITILISGLIVWFLVVVMLVVTQDIPTSQLIFEATSALATVGLSTGATLQLDEIGKVIVIIAMFVGRVGPVTLFMMLHTEATGSKCRYTEEKITLT